MNARNADILCTDEKQAELSTWLDRYACADEL